MFGSFVKKCVLVEAVGMLARMENLLGLPVAAAFEPPVFLVFKKFTATSFEIQKWQAFAWVGAMPQPPCIDHADVNIVGKYWPPPLLASYTNSIIRHHVVGKINASHELGIICDELWLLHLHVLAFASAEA